MKLACIRQTKPADSVRRRRPGTGITPRERRPYPAWLLSAALLCAAPLILAMTPLLPPARAAVYLNEAVVRGTESVELYNSGPDSVFLGGWRIDGSLGSYPLPPVSIPPDGYLSFVDIGSIFGEIGGEISIIDDFDYLQDHVDYGDLGGAPLPHDDPGVSLCRAPDGSSSPPLDPANDALYFTLDLTSTFGAPNDAPPPDLGSSLIINEIDPGTGGRVPDGTVELYNPTGGPILTFGWYLTFGAGSTFFLPPSTVPPGGVHVFTVPSDIDPLTTKLVYLFNDAGVRVDQLGFEGGPFARGGSCLGRCPDGAGPNDGYDYASSGGGETLLALTCTLGRLNILAPECHGSVPVKLSTWGGVKAIWGGVQAIYRE